MREPQTWKKKISPGGQISVPVELMRSLGVDVGDSVYLFLYGGRAFLLAEKDAAPLLEEVMRRAGLISKKDTRRSS